MHKPFNARHEQTGASLVVSMILLVAISMMAVSSMSNTALDLVIAGNEQFRSRAFTAAEAGIEQAWNNGTFSSAADFTQPATATGSGNDTYQYTITRPTGGAVSNPPSGFTSGTFGMVYFNVTATGTSERSAQAVTTQEMYEVVRSAEDATYNKSVCAGTANLDAAASSC